MSTATEQIRSTKHEVPSARDTESVVASGEGSAQPAPRWLKPDRFSDGIVIMLVLTGLQRLVGFGRSVLLCLFLSPYELGHWDIAFGFLTLAAPIAVLSLPAAFGRYVEYYRQRGQLRTFLRRIAVATVILAVTAALAIAFGAERFSQWIFGAADHAGLVRLVAATLLANILYNVVAELFTALRMQRIASGMEFVQSLAFATLAVALVSTWESRATSIVLAYGGACLVALAMSSVWLWFSWREIPAAAQPAAQGAFWSKLIPFVAWVWVANWLANLFLYVDRYMVVHFSRMTNEAATALVGQYHSSRLVPQLLVTVAAVLSGVMIPFLSRDWEIGRTDRLSARMNLLIKLTGLGLTAAAALVLAASPLLFGVVFKGKFDAGLEVLPWTLIYSAWFGILCVARVYLWCAEKVRLVSIAYLAGLLVNIGMNLLLVPHLGLLGAVLGTCAAHFMALGMVYAISAANGLRLDRGIWLISLLPLTLLSGPWGALGATAMAIALSL
ncbi:MAG TPA: lipopolysaccharide biosynthesis protein, partial [Pirellulales bacterium]|nr:lipopolysaccharide biosynthesis protein [Pirellulales bacterium]